MRFAEPFAQSGKSPEAKLEAERLMFLRIDTRFDTYF